MMKTITIVIVLLFCFNSNSQTVAPSIFNSAGGSSQSGYYQFEWSIGELSLIGEMASPNKSFVITNGFVQPFVHNPARNNTVNVFGNDEIKIFPNPASSYVEINFMTKQKGRITMTFYDGSGRRIYTSSDVSHGVGLIKRIPVDKLPNEVYMLHVDLDPEPGSMAKQGVYKVIKIK